MKHYYALAILVAVFVCACSPSASVSTPSPSQTLSPSATVTPTTRPVFGYSSATPVPPTPTIATPTPLPLPPALETRYGSPAVPGGAWMRLGMGSRTQTRLSPNQQFLAVGTNTGVYVYDSPTMTQLWSQATRSPIEQIEWSPDSAQIAASLFEWGNVLVWDAKTGDLVQRLENDSEVAAISISPDGAKLAVGLGSFSLVDPYDSIDGIALWDLQSGSRLTTWSKLPNGDNYDHPVVGLAWSPDGALVAATVGYFTIALIDVDSGEAIRLLEQPSSPHGEVQYVDLSPDGSKLVTYTGISGPGDAPGGDRRAHLWDTNSGKLLYSLETSHKVIGSNWSPDSKTLVTESYEWENSIYEINVWDVIFGTRVGQHSTDLNNYQWASDSARFISGELGSGQIVEWSASTGEFVRWGYQFGDLPSYGTEFYISTIGNGQYLVWDTPTGTPEFKFEAPRFVNDVVWSPDGAQIAEVPSVDSDEPTKLWSTQTGVPTTVLSRSETLPDWISHHPSTQGLFCPEVGYEISGGAGSRTVTYTTQDEEAGTFVKTSQDSNDDERGTLIDITAPFGNQQMSDPQVICSIAISPDGRFLAVGHAAAHRGIMSLSVTNIDDSDILVWDLSTGSQVYHFIGHTGSVAQLEWSPDGSFLASRSADGTVLIWRTSQ